eukprot:357971-Chlamydomonas_euryale.AAC.2
MLAQSNPIAPAEAASCPSSCLLPTSLSCRAAFPQLPPPHTTPPLSCTPSLHTNTRTTASPRTCAATCVPYGAAVAVVAVDAVALPALHPL